MFNVRLAVYIALGILSIVAFISLLFGRKKDHLRKYYDKYKEEHYGPKKKGFWWRVFNSGYNAPREDEDYETYMTYVKGGTVWVISGLIIAWISVLLLDAFNVF